MIVIHTVCLDNVNPYISPPVLYVWVVYDIQNNQLVFVTKSAAFHVIPYIIFTLITALLWVMTRRVAVICVTTQKIAVLSFFAVEI